MRVIGGDCCDAQRWTDWIQEGKEGIGDDIEVHVIAGEDDGIFPVENCLELSQILGMSEERFHVISGGAHAFMLEKPAEVTKILLDCFKKQ